MSLTLEQIESIAGVTVVVAVLGAALIYAFGGLRGPDGKPKQKTVLDLVNYNYPQGGTLDY